MEKKSWIFKVLSKAYLCSLGHSEFTVYRCRQSMLFHRSYHIIVIMLIQGYPKAKVSNHHCAAADKINLIWGKIMYDNSYKIYPDYPYEVSSLIY